MAWQSGPTNPKYRSAEHKRLRKHYADLIRAGYPQDCTADDCVYDWAPIVNANGNDDDGLHLGHNPDGVTYAGPQHRTCNLLDASRRGHAEQQAARARHRAWAL